MDSFVQLILFIGWPIIIIASIYVYARGRSVYSHVKGSLIGRITKTLVLSLMLEMYSIGAACTAYMLIDSKSIYLVSMIFAILLAVFIATIRMVKLASDETKKIIEGNNQK